MSLCEVRTHFSLHSLSHIKVTNLLWNETGNRAHHPLTLTHHRKSSCKLKTAGVGKQSFLHWLLKSLFLSVVAKTVLLYTSIQFLFSFHFQFHIKVWSRPHQQAMWPRGWKQGPGQNWIRHASRAVISNWTYRSVCEEIILAWIFLHFIVISLK